MRSSISSAFRPGRYQAIIPTFIVGWHPERLRVYEFQDWKLACGGTQMYNMVNDGAAREFSYSPLTL
jgi:hypothetical protein